MPRTLYAPWVPGDGRYVIHPAGGERFTVHCADMLTAGLDYLEIRSGPGVNFSSYAAGGAAIGTTVTTSFTKIRLDPANLTVDVGDLRFATSTGSLVHPDAGGDQTVLSMPYATAMGCEAGVANGTANVNLQGTPFAVDDTFGVDDSGHRQRDLLGARPGRGPDRRRILRMDRARTAAVQPVQPGTRAVHPRPALPERAGRPRCRLRSCSPRSRGRRSTADLYALVDGAEDLPVTVEVRASASCTGGSLDSPSLVATLTQQTDADGYVLFEGVSGHRLRRVRDDHRHRADGHGRIGLHPHHRRQRRVAARAATGPHGRPPSVSDVIEADGRARWYRFAIVPNQRITVTLSGLPADYDLAVFRDIGKEFASQLAPQDADSLTRLSAEFAPSVFSPSVFSPSVFSPSVFSPDAYAPSVFSPSVFSPSVFSPSVFSPSVFSPSVFSPMRVLSPSVFSPSVFSPSVFSARRCSARPCSARASSATRSSRRRSRARRAAAWSASRRRRERATETVVVNSWNNTGSFYVRVAGRGGAFDPDQPLHPRTSTAPASTCAGVTDTDASPTVSPPRVPGPSRR